LTQIASSEKQILCPSAQLGWQGSVAIGVVGGTVEHPDVRHFPAPLPVTEELIRLAAPVTPPEVFRFAAPCQNGKCVHFEHSQCRLVTRIVQLLPSVTERLPVCSIRSNCRWWQQEGKAACLRCPQVVTNNSNPSETMREAAGPTAPYPVSQGQSCF
jgi:hypothetical protein